MRLFSFSAIVLMTGFCQTLVGQQDCTLSIINQPLPQTDCYGNHVEFSVEINGAQGTVIYQWQQKSPGGVFSDIAGGNAAFLPVDNIGVNGLNVDGTEYRVVVKDDCIALTSNSALLHINAITGISPSVVNSTICSGGTIVYTVTTQGNVEGYQWGWNTGSGWNYLTEGGPYSGTASSQLTISNATTSQTASYRISVTFTTLNQPPGDPTCIETSFTRNRNLQVRPPFIPPVISSGQQICAGNLPSSLSATPASGGSGPGYSYQWQSSAGGNVWSVIAGATSLNYSPPVLTSSTSYRIVASDVGTPSCGSVNSLPVVVSVIPIPATSPIYHR